MWMKRPARWQPCMVIKRVLKDSLPTPEWKNEIWKDGIANIDEQLNGVVNGPQDIIQAI